MPELEETPPSLDRFRTALKFSLCTWALYWPGGGILLLIHGLDPISILVTVASLGSFLFLVAFGGLRTTASRNMKEFLIERPMYLLLAFVLLLIFVGAVPTGSQDGETGGLAIFSSIYLAGVGLAAYRLWVHLKETDTSIYASRADQTFIVFGVTAFVSLLVFLDAWLPILGAGTVGGAPMFIAIANWLNLLYPPLIMIAAKPFREPLVRPRRRREPTEEPVAEAVKRVKG